MIELPDSQKSLSIVKATVFNSFQSRSWCMSLIASNLFFNRVQNFVNVASECFQLFESTGTIIGLLIWKCRTPEGVSFPRLYWTEEDVILSTLVPVTKILFASSQSSTTFLVIVRFSFTSILKTIHCLHRTFGCY